MTRKVLITRHPADCRELQELVRPCDVTLRAYPVLRLEDIDDRAGWNVIRTATAESQVPVASWLVFASPRAPHRFVKAARSHKLPRLLDLPTAAVGESTATSIREAGLTVELEGPGTGAGLAGVLLQRLAPSSTIVLACGHDRRRELPELLEAEGHTVLPVVVYRMRPTPPRELPPLGDRLDSVVLTSPRAAQLYLDGVGGLPLPCQHWALGPTTRDAAVALGIDCRIPQQPTLRSLAEELCRT
ncbi:MAG: uroporphyrinogen-III synthase [bacterium]|nr:uroporphyrinogen-III synthase [bacterium]